MDTQVGLVEPVVADDLYWMRQALAWAAAAPEAGEVPVGALLVQDNRMLAAAHNRPICDHDPSAHAEMLVIRQAAQQQCNYRLPNTTLYVTLEPCVMCAGAIIHARIARVVFGAFDPKAGAVNSVYDVISNPRLNHAPAWTGGVLQDECATQLRNFFKARRKLAQAQLPS